MKRLRNDDDPPSDLVSGHSALVVRVSQLQEDIIAQLTSFVRDCLADSSTWFYRVTQMSEDASWGKARRSCEFQLLLLCDVTVPPGSGAQFEETKRHTDDVCNKLQVALDIDTWRIIRDGMHLFLLQVCKSSLAGQKYDATVFPRVPAQSEQWEVQDYSHSSATVCFTFFGAEPTQEVYTEYRTKKNKN
jgi:hypothetical protein